MAKNVSKARFIVPSVVGIFLFMIPIKVDGSWTIAVKIIADWISAIAESILPGLCLFILTVSAVQGAAGGFQEGTDLRNGNSEAEVHLHQ